jgi:hypothetical protein
LEYENTNPDYFKGLYTLSCFLLLSFLGLMTEGGVGEQRGGGAGERRSRGAKEQGGGGRITMPNAQFPIPNSQFPIPNP